MTTPSATAAAPSAAARGAGSTGHARWRHAAFALALGLAACLLSLHLSARLPAELYRPYAADVWFQADLQRVVENMTDAHSNHYRNKVHPIASLVAFPVATTLQLLHPMPALDAARAASALWAGAWAAMLYALFVALALPAAAASAFVLLALASASFLLFFSVPELYHLGSLSLLAVLLGAARAVRRGIGERGVIGLGLASLAITTTNWMAGLALAATHLPWRRAIRCSAWVLGITVALALVQKLLFPSSGLFFLPPAAEALYVGRPEAGTPWHRLAGMLLSPLVLPDLLALQPAKEGLWPLLSVQLSPPGGSRGTGQPALALWLVLLGAGLAGARNLGPAWRRFLLVLFGTLAGQVALHLVYGEETFLYGLHFLPLLLAVAALAWHTRLRPLVVPIAVLAAVLALPNNLAGLHEAIARLDGSLTQRERLQRAIAARPDAAWPRNEGHVVLAGPGTALDRKGFHEPGGSFSPAPGSFGVSVWVTDAQGRRVATSDTLPLAQVAQSLVDQPGGAVPALVTETPLYRARWSWEGGPYALDLQPPRPGTPHRLWVLLRSAGPAGGPLRSIVREPGRLVLDGRWEVATPAAGRALLGDEETGAIDLRRDTVQPVLLRTDPPSGADRLASPGAGWLYAALPVGPDGLQATIRDLQAAPDDPLPVGRSWAPELPDARFVAMARAQQAHLLMGLTDGGTRPGEPVSYDTEWMRDGAYVVAALARAGQGAAAERLARAMAPRDWFGGFGAEADAPGLGIWALAEASRAAGDPGFDRWAWPHVRRKAGLVEACLSATRSLVVQPQGPVLASYRDDPLTRRPCEPALGGLSVGHMDHQYPVLFVNAIHHLALREAAGFARRIGEAQEAARLDARADAVAVAWRARYLATPRDASRQLLERAPQLALGLLRQQPGFKQMVGDWLRAPANERTYVAWASGVLGADTALRSAFEARLQDRWTAQHDAAGHWRETPRWTYFTFAEAHQWLALGRPERAWRTLGSFMDAAASPGLYTWWEEGTEENASYRWTGIRGGTDPRRITPHYWSAAEALLLQMAMLARVDRTDPAAPLVIGAGVPAAWLSHRLDSGALVTERGPVRWTWDGQRLQVDVADAGIPVRIAPVFGAASVVVRAGTGATP